MTLLWTTTTFIELAFDDVFLILNHGQKIQLLL